MKILEGTWDNFPGKWEFILDSTFPDFKLCTSVAFISFYKDYLLLTKNDRGWELPGGHIEENETLQEALIREIKEEVGADVNSSKYLGYFKIFPDKPIQKKDGTFYPFPYSYIPVYICECENIGEFTGEEILDTKQLKISEIDNFDFTNKKAVQLLLKYR